MKNSLEKKKDDLESILDVDITITKQPRPTIIPKETANTNLALTGEAKDLVNQFENLPKLGEDFELSRGTIQEIVEKGRQLIDEMISVARGAENPLMYQATATFLRTMVDAAKSLLEIHEKMKIINGKGSGENSGNKENSSTTINVDKAVFVGSTTEAIKQLKEAARVIETEFTDVTEK